MPVILKIEHKDSQRTAVWEIKEDEYALLEKASLNKTALNAFHLITNPGRRLEWLAARALLGEFYSVRPIINYLKTGKPVFINHTDKISISHSGSMVAIAIHSHRNPGIDIEKAHPRIFKIAARFLNESENAYLGKKPSIEQLTVLWGAKEVMFKVYEHGGVSFKNDFMINPFSISRKGSLTGIIHAGNVISVPMEYMQIQDFILVQTDYSYGILKKNPTFGIL